MARSVKWEALPVVTQTAIAMCSGTHASFSAGQEFRERGRIAAGDRPQLAGKAPPSPSLTDRETTGSRYSVNFRRDVTGAGWQCDAV
jgi:hypothetical protein